MKKELDFRRPIKELIDNGFSRPEIKEFYYSLMKKLKETYDFKSIDEIIPETAFCVPMILQHRIENGLDYEQIGASEIYELDDMTLNLDIQNPGYSPRTAFPSFLGRYLIFLQTSNLATDHYNRCFSTKDKLPNLKTYFTSLTINVFNSKKGIEEFLENRLKNI
jgi:hypothetical protein